MKRRAFKPLNDPMEQLVLALRVAAANIYSPPSREHAAREARLIAQTYAERMPNTALGKVAKAARAALANLPKLEPEDRDDVAKSLRAFAATLSKPVRRHPRKKEAAA